MPSVLATSHKRKLIGEHDEKSAGSQSSLSCNDGRSHVK